MIWLVLIAIVIVLVLLPKPKDKIEPKNLHFEKPKNKTKITKNKYNEEKKTPEEIDVIVIGSGMAGLTCASVLGNYGKKVLVLEQNATAGGSTHTFTKKNFVFDTGLHYVGDVEGYNRIFDFICYEPGSVEFEKMGSEEDGYAYDQIILKTPNGERTHVFRAGKDNFIGDLVEKFPEDERAIRNWVREIENISKKGPLMVISQLLPPFWGNLWKKVFCRGFMKLYRMSPIEVISQWTDNTELIAILTSQFGDYGTTPDKSSFYYHAGVVNHFFEGAYYPIGGAETFAAEIITNILSREGAVWTKARVDTILLNEERTKAIGVRLFDGREIFANQIVSSVGAMNTYEHLLPNLGFNLPDWQPSTGHIYLFLGIDGTTEELGLDSYNKWILSCDEDFDVVKACEEFYANPFESDRSLCFISSPSAKDPHVTKLFPTKSTAILITEGRGEWFEEYKDLKKGKRGEEYNTLKKIFEDRLLKIFFEQYPKCEGKISFCWTGTPLTNSHYIGSYNGCSYGLNHTPETRDWNYTSIQSPIEGLYLSGQDTLCCGIYAAVISGVLTSMRMIDYGPVRLLSLVQPN